MPSLVEPSKKKENAMIQKRSGSFKNYVGFFLNIASNNDIILNMSKTSNISSLYGLNKLIQDTNNPKNKPPKNTKKGNSKNEAKNEDNTWFDKSHIKSEIITWLEDLDYQVKDIKIKENEILENERKS